MACQVSLPVASSPQPKAIILGAGPAGLSAALELIKGGYCPIIIEGRSCEQVSLKGRVHPVILSEDRIDQLEAHKVYSHLLKENLIFPLLDHRCTVRLTDLEQGMKKSLESYTDSQNQIRYQTSVERIIEKDEGKVDLLLNSGEVIQDLDVVVNAEGAHSSTNKLLGNHRIEVLGELLAVYSILRDDRPSVKNISTFLESGVKKIRNIAHSIRDHSIYLALLTFTGEHFFSSSRKIAIAATLKTPGQHRVGLAFTQKKAAELKQLQEDVQAGHCTPEELNKQLEFWTRMALCEVNVFSVLQKFGSLVGVKENRLVAASHFPIESANLLKIRSDRAEKMAIVKGKTLFLITGDALATVDPSAVLGCNTAIQLGPRIKQVFDEIRQGKDLSEIATSYSQTCDEWIGRNHGIAKTVRKKFDPSSYDQPKVAV